VVELNCQQDIGLHCVFIHEFEVSYTMVWGKF